MKPLSFLAMAAVLVGAPAGIVAAAPGAGGVVAEAQPTVVECEGASEMVSTATETVAIFHDKVVVTGTNLKMYCDQLRVVATRKGDPNATIGKYGTFKSLIATGHVRILQAQPEREATCGRAEVFPGEDRIVLSENPVVRDPGDNYVATGYRMILYHGQRRAVIETAPGERTRITLPPIKNLGLDEAETPPGSAGPPAETSR